jgi:hypothetical protein
MSETCVLCGNTGFGLLLTKEEVVEMFDETTGWNRMIHPLCAEDLGWDLGDLL